MLLHRGAEDFPEFIGQTVKCYKCEEPHDAASGISVMFLALFKNPDGSEKQKIRFELFCGSCIINFIPEQIPFQGRA